MTTSTGIPRTNGVYDSKPRMEMHMYEKVSKKFPEMYVFVVASITEMMKGLKPNILGL